MTVRFSLERLIRWRTVNEPDDLIRRAELRFHGAIRGKRISKAQARMDANLNQREG